MTWDLLLYPEATISTHYLLPIFILRVSDHQRSDLMNEVLNLKKLQVAIRNPNSTAKQIPRFRVALVKPTE